MTFTNTAGHPWPLYYEDNVCLGNPDSHTAIISLWTKKEHVQSVINDDHYVLLGQLYSQSYGIEILCRNLLANNQVRYLAVTGIDLNDVSPGLINIFEYGLNDDQTIIGTDIEVSDDLAAYLGELRDRVTLIDERQSNDFEDLNTVLDSLPAKEPRGDEIILDLPDIVQPTRFPTDFAGFRVRGRSFEETWHQTLRRILLFGSYDAEQHRLRATNFLAHAKTYTDDDHALLNQAPPQSPEGTTTTIDSTEHTMIQRETVEAWTELRSILRDTHPPVTLTAQTLYLDEPDIKKAIEAAAPRHKHDRNPDPHGNIIIQVNDDHIALLHCNQEGEVIDEQRGTTKEELFHQLESYYKISLTDHALDIGAEIQKALIAYKHEQIDYEQDKPLTLPTNIYKTTEAST